MADAKQIRIGSYVSATSFGATNVALDSTGDKTALVFQAVNGDAITHVGIRYASRTGTPPTYRIGLQGVSASTGAPDGTYVGGGTPASTTFTPPANTSIDGTWQWYALDNAYTPTPGEVLALVVEYSSGTNDASNYSSITRADSANSISPPLIRPYNVNNTTGTYAKVSVSPLGGWRTASGRFGYVLQSGYAGTVSTSGHRIAMHFTLPSGHGDTFKVAGFRCRTSLVGAPTAGLWDASSLLQSSSVDVDQISTSAGVVDIIFADSTLATLSFGTKYYIGFQASGSAVGIRGAQLAHADDRLAYQLGDAMGLATFDGSTWTEDNTVVPALELILADITEPSGGGGGVVFGSHGPLFRAA